MMKLWEIAHSRTGDKGNISNISLIAYDMKDFELIKEKVTPEKVKDFFKDIVKSEVVRYELPNVGALNFVMYDALGGGVTRSLSLDKHGKSLSSYILEMEI
ncbi:AtuA-related protein [Youngiibacter multivorans]